MKRGIASAVVTLVVTMTVVGCVHHSPTEGWITLIDGNAGMDNWSVTGSAANWRAEDGAIQADKTTGKGASVLVSKRSFKDLELYTEFWAGDDTNSGVYIRAPNPNTVNTASGAYEVQIWDKSPDPSRSTGALLPVATVAPVYKAGGRWNTYEIYAKGTQITVKLNGVVTASIQDAKTHEGRIGLQFNGGPIKFRKLLVKEL
ncbi:MAG: 3-keto-disaccharide hydrolase [Burkholderiales bacterium]